MIFRKFTLLIGSGLMLAWASSARAETLPQYPIDAEVLESELIVRAVPMGGAHVQVKEVFTGEAKAGQVLSLEHFGKLPTRKFDSPIDDLYLSMLQQSHPEQVPASSPISGEVILFLSRDRKQNWELEGYGSGVKWIEDGKIFGYEQLSNPGGYTIVPEFEAANPTDLIKLIEASIAKKKRFLAAKSTLPLSKRVEKLSEFVGPQEHGYWYFQPALREISQTGPIGFALLSWEADNFKQRIRRREFLQALGNSRTPSAIAFVLAAAQRSELLVKSGDANPADPLLTKVDLTEEDFLFPPNLLHQGLKPRLSLTPLDRAIRDWDASIYVLSDVGDDASVPLFRSALLWGVLHRNRGELMESALRGLTRYPSRENIPYIAKALETIPAGPYDWTAVSYCLEALKAHPYLESVPVLANELQPRKSNQLVDNGDRTNHPEENATKAHELLIAIVGRDLGASKEPWLKWLDEQPK